MGIKCDNRPVNSRHARALLVMLLLGVFVAGCRGTGESSVVETEGLLAVDEADIETPAFAEHEYTADGLADQLAEEPERADLAFLLMRVRMEAADYQGALEMLETLDEQGDPQWSAQGHMLAGKIMREKLAAHAEGDMREEMLAKAARQFEISVEIDPSTANLAAYWYLGDLQYELGNTEDAIENLSIYLILQPYAYDVRMKLAEIYLAEGSVDRARKLLEGMKTDPNEQRRLRAENLLEDMEEGGREYYIVVVVLAVLIIAWAGVIYIFKRKLIGGIPRRPG